MLGYIKLGWARLTPIYLNFFSTYLNLFTTYLRIKFLNNNFLNDFNLGIKLTQSNGSLSTSQIVNHFVSHSTSQNDKV
jgi:hypothetical protein